MTTNTDTNTNTQIDFESYRHHNSESTNLDNIHLTLLRRFTPGKLLSVADTVDAILSDQYVFVGGIPYHPKWSMNWSVSFIVRLCNNSYIREAIEIGADH